MKCLRCNATNYFHTDEYGTYCRKCVVFSRININEKPRKCRIPKNHSKIKIDLPYELTVEQKFISQSILENIQTHHCFIKAVCGAGKTEILLPIIEYYINNAKTVCIAIPRRQVVLELYERIKKIFQNLDIACVCEGYTRKTKAPLVICTTHQLYRYHQAFDLLIIDEVDAFPFKNNQTLQFIANNCCIEKKIWMSATINNEIKNNLLNENFKIFHLNKRYHNRKIPIPKIYYMPNILQILFTLFFIIRYQPLTKLIFVPTIALCTQYSKIFGMFFKVFQFTSQSDNKDTLLSNLQKQSNKIVFTTTILERGITIPDASVLVLHSNHFIFETENLIQIAGRVDRNTITYHAPIYFLSSKKMDKITNCIKQLEECNV